MITVQTTENVTRLERILGQDTLHAKTKFPEGGLFREQRLTCANHSEEEIILTNIGWKNFTCPKCGCDYSIGRKIVILQ